MKFYLHFYARLAESYLCFFLTQMVCLKSFISFSFKLHSLSVRVSMYPFRCLICLQICALYARYTIFYIDCYMSFGKHLQNQCLSWFNCSETSVFVSMIRVGYYFDYLSFSYTLKQLHFQQRQP